MRILSVSHFFAEHGGGIELVAGQIDRALADQEHETRWAAADEGATTSARRVPLRTVDWLERATGLPMPIPLPGAIRRLWRAVGEAEAVVVHDALYLSSIVALVAARVRRRPVLLIQHIADIPFSSGVLRAVMTLANRLVTRPMLRHADQVVFISATVRDRFADARFRRPPLLLFNGVDTGVFHPVAEDERERLRARLGWSGERMMLFVGRFVEKKGLAVIAALARRRPDRRFVLVGRGPIDPASWSLANVGVLPHQGPEALADLYRAADLLVLPSVGEGFPLVIQEAMACGLRAVCGDDTAAADPDATRWIGAARVDLGDPEASAARVEAAIDALPPGPAPAAMAAGAAERYSWPGMAAAVAAALARLSR